MTELFFRRNDLLLVGCRDQKFEYRIWKREGFESEASNSMTEHWLDCGWHKHSVPRLLNAEPTAFENQFPFQIWCRDRLREKEGGGLKGLMMKL